MSGFIRPAPNAKLIYQDTSMNASAEQTPIDENNSVDEATSGSGWKIRLGVLCAMLALALAGMGFTQASETGAWEFWLFVVLVYAALGLWRCSRSAKQTGQSIKKGILRELSHWGTLIGFLAVLLFLERREIIDRQSASYFALMLLALSCCMAGVHIDWLLLVVGVVLTIMLVAMATLEQFSVWIIMMLVAGLAAAFFYIKSKRGGSEVETIE
jgi:hypothetical protein